MRHSNLTRAFCATLCCLMTVGVLPALWMTPSSAREAEEDTPAPVDAVAPIACDNITINAYLVPLYDAETRKTQFTYCKNAEVDILSHIYTRSTWVREDHTFDTYQMLMQEAAAYGLQVQTREVRLQDALKYTDEELVAVAQAYRDLPGFAGFYIVDEPLNPNPYARAENALRTVCPDTWVNVNFLPRGCYAEGTYIKQLTDYGSLLTQSGTLSLDTYNFLLNGQVDEYGLFKNYDDLRRAGLMTGTNTAVYVQSVGLEGGYRRPSPSDLRYNMMAAVAYGMKELKFFCWATPPAGEGNYTDAIIGRDGQPTDLYDEVCRINHKIHSVGQYLAGCDALYVYHSTASDAYPQVPEDLFIQPASGAKVILSLFRARDGESAYLMIVNKNFKAAQTVSFTVSGVSGLQMINGETGDLENLSLKDGTFTLTLAAGDGEVIKLPASDLVPDRLPDSIPANTDMAPTARVKASDSAGDGEMYLYNLYDGVSDGNGARLTSTDGSDQWILFDLGTTRKINRVDIAPAGSGPVCGAYYPRQLTLWGSSDGSTWVRLSERSFRRVRDNVPIFRFAAEEIRFLKICVSGYSDSIRFFELGDIGIYYDDGSMDQVIPTRYEKPSDLEGGNIALGKPVFDFSSTTDVPAWTCHHTYINDGNLKQAWASELGRNNRPDAEEWIIIDLVDVYDIDKVVLYPRDALNGYNVFPEDYEIRVSLDGNAYTTVCRVEGDNNPQTQDVRTLTFEATPARYVQLLATRLTHSSSATSGYCIEMNEMEIYGVLNQEMYDETDPEPEPDTDPVTEPTTEPDTEPCTDAPQETTAGTLPETATSAATSAATDPVPETDAATLPPAPTTESETDAPASTGCGSTLPLTAVAVPAVVGLAVVTGTRRKRRQ